MNSTRSGLVAYILSGGKIVCVDCDVYPPGAEDVRQDAVDDIVACDECGQRLADVSPVGANPS